MKAVELLLKTLVVGGAAWLTVLSLSTPRKPTAEATQMFTGDQTPSTARTTHAGVREPQAGNRPTVTDGQARKSDAATQRLKAAGQYDSLMQALQAARYAVEPPSAESDRQSEPAHYAQNLAQGLRCWFGTDGLELQPAAANQSPWKLKVRLQGYGRGQLAKASVDGATARQNRVELSHDGGAVVEWYENKAVGLEQGFTIQRAPAGDGPLRLIVQAEGDLRPELETEESPGLRKALSSLTPVSALAHPAAGAPDGSIETGTAVTFHSADGHEVLRYGGLKVWDAAQRELPAHLELKGRQLALVVDDEDAAYPITIDPLFTTQEAKLTAGDGSAGDKFLFSSVTLSGDGNTALVGVPYDDTSAGTYAGSAYVYVRSGSSWSQQAQLTADDGADKDRFGFAVSLSGDGNTALVGTFWHDTPAGPGAGSAYVFVRSGSSWSQQAQLTAGDGAVMDRFGNAASLSGDGNTALVGAAWAGILDGNDDAGSAYVFVRSGSNWSQQAQLTAGDGAAAKRYFGSAVSLSGDGNTALVGAVLDGSARHDAGSAYVFRLLTCVDIGLRVFDGQNTIHIACERPGGGGVFYSPVRVAKDGTSYGILLVDTNAPDATRVQVKTSSGIKAWRKLP